MLLNLKYYYYSKNLNYTFWVCFVLKQLWHRFLKYIYFLHFLDYLSCLNIFLEILEYLFFIKLFQMLLDLNLICWSSPPSHHSTPFSSRLHPFPLERETHHFHMCNIWEFKNRGRRIEERIIKRKGERLLHPYFIML